jgi:hypothetical protein
VAGAVKLAVQCHKKKKSWREARDAILEKYRGRMHGYDPARLSDEDRRKGFAEGQRGWDAPSNLGILVVGLLYGEGDFGETICVAVNCGEDTDCTGATAGAMFGIIHGIDAIPQKWIEPIGRDKNDQSQHGRYTLADSEGRGQPDGADREDGAAGDPP